MVSTFNDGYEVRRLMGDVMSDYGIKYGYGLMDVVVLDLWGKLRNKTKTETWEE